MTICVQPQHEQTIPRPKQCGLNPTPIELDEVELGVENVPIIQRF